MARSSPDLRFANILSFSDYSLICNARGAAAGISLGRVAGYNLEAWDLPRPGGLRQPIKMAEREGFEPSAEISPRTRLAGEHLRPLGHLS